MGTANASTIRVMMIEDHALVRACLRMLLESQGGIAVVGEADDPTKALAAVTCDPPDIILLDLALGNADGLDLLPQLRDAAPTARVIVLTGLRDPEVHRRAVRLGALGMVRKEQASEVLLQAIAKVYAGEAWLDRSLVASVLGEMTRVGAAQASDPEGDRIATLTAREREVILLIGQGRKNRAIAEHLCISDATVRHHLTAIFTKLGVADRLELVIYAYRHGLVRLP